MTVEILSKPQRAYGEDHQDMWNRSIKCSILLLITQYLV